MRRRVDEAGAQRGDQDVVARILLAPLASDRPDGRHLRDLGGDVEPPREALLLRTALVSARAIGERLCISERTVEAHIAHVYLNLDIHSRVELARRADALAL